MSAPVIDKIPFDAPEDERILFAEQFRDEFGNHARTTTPFLAHLLDVRLINRANTKADLDEALWWTLSSDTEQISLPACSGASLSEQTDEMAIEHWTQIELCALHALWTMVALYPNKLDTPLQAVRSRIRSAGVWMMNEYQPDNAINRPWAIGVFVQLSLTLESADERSTASMYAQTLLHNCSITLGRPDLLSACILKDASRTLMKL